MSRELRTYMSSDHDPEKCTGQQEWPERDLVTRPGLVSEEKRCRVQGGQCQAGHGGEGEVVPACPAERQAAECGELDVSSAEGRR